MVPRGSVNSGAHNIDWEGWGVKDMEDCVLTLGMVPIFSTTVMQSLPGMGSSGNEGPMLSLEKGSRPYSRRS